jgi:hypothetical protein
MRTTIRLADDCGEKLRALAAARGDKGVAKVVEDAVSFYLAEREKPAVIPAAPPALPGRWERAGAYVDRSLTDRPSLLQLATRVLRLRFQRWAA